MPTDLNIDEIQKLQGHDRSEAIERFAKSSSRDVEKISLLIFALNDADYQFCTYENCVRSAASYLYDLRDALTAPEQRSAILQMLLDDLDVNFSNTDDHLDRVRLLGIFKDEARPALATLKSALEEYGDDSEYANAAGYQDSFEFECRSTLKEAIRLIENTAP